jgi:GST-like protein
MAGIINFLRVPNPERRNVDLSNYPNAKRWHDAIATRPGVQRGVEALSKNQRKGQMPAAKRGIMFGKPQFAVR